MAVPATWVDLGPLVDRHVVITGATSGLGRAAALAVAGAGARLTITARDSRKAAETLAEVSAVASHPVHVVSLDLADLDSVRAATSTWTLGDIDVLVNNAGVMVPPFTHTPQGFELQMGTNHVGHFAWTARLWPRLTSARVVTVSSLAHAQTRGVDLRALEPHGDPRRYVRWRSYAESKLANLLFAAELDRRLRAVGSSATSVAAHPGISNTPLMTAGSGMRGPTPLSHAIGWGGRLVGQPADHGVAPLLAAATAPADGGEYWGPAGFQQWRGAPRRVGRSATARDTARAADLWRASETATSLTFDVT